VIEEFQWPSNGVGLLDGDQNSSVTIRQFIYFEWGLNFVNCLHIHPHCAITTKFFWITQKGMGGRHEMTIRTKGQGKKWKKEGKKAIKTRGKYWQD
jgi:hypothetical protein